MNNAKLLVTFAVVALLHLGAGTVIMLQPGCHSDSAKTAAAPPAEAANNTVAATPPPAPAPQLSPPTRPAEPIPVANLSSPQEPLTPASGNQLNPPFAASSGQVPAAGEQYTVKAGDSLTTLARKFNTSIPAIRAANNLPNDRIRIGQVLVMPAPEAAPSAPPPAPAPASASVAASGTSYTVKSGDVLGGIARQFGTTVPAIQAANNLSGTNIRAGQVLVIPSGGAATASAASTRPVAASSTPPSAAVTITEVDVYVVKSGDTPEGIAKAHGVKLAELMTLNNISDPRRLQLGQKLKIPAGGTAPAAPAPAPAAAAPVAPPVAPPVEVVVPVETIDTPPPITPITPLAPN